jgi:hypothetical protein
MGSELLCRVRWRNVSRAVLAVSVVAAVVAWPRLAPREPRVPDLAARPLPAAPVVTPESTPRPRVVRPPRQRRHRPVVTRHPRVRRRRETVGPRVVVPPRNNPGIEGGGAAARPVVGGGTPAAPSPAPPPAPTPDLPEAEFGFER